MAAEKSFFQLTSLSLLVKPPVFGGLSHPGTYHKGSIIMISHIIMIRAQALIIRTVLVLSVHLQMKPNGAFHVPHLDHPSQ